MTRTVILVLSLILLAKGGNFTLILQIFMPRVDTISITHSTSMPFLPLKSLRKDSTMAMSLWVFPLMIDIHKKSHSTTTLKDAPANWYLNLVRKIIQSWDTLWRRTLTHLVILHGFGPIHLSHSHRRVTCKLSPVPPLIELYGQSLIPTMSFTRMELTTIITVNLYTGCLQIRKSNCKTTMEMSFTHFRLQTTKKGLFNFHSQDLVPHSTANSIHNSIGTESF